MNRFHFITGGQGLRLGSVLWAVAMFITVNISPKMSVADEQGPFFTVRTAGPISPEANEWLAKIAKQREVPVRKGTDLRTLVEQFCGGVSDDYLNRLKQSNTGLENLQASNDGIVEFPACFYVKSNAALTVRAGDNLSKIAQSTVGAAGPQTIGNIVIGNGLKVPFQLPSLTSLPKNVPLKPGQQLILPFATEAVRYELNTNAVSDVSTALAELQRTAKSSAPTQGVPVLEATPSKDERLLLPIEVSARPQSGPPCAGKGLNWPFNVSQVASILTRNLAAMRMYGLEPEQIKVAVVDTGLDGFGGAAFPQAAFDLNRTELAGAPDQDNDGNGWIHDVYGINVYDDGKEPVGFRKYDGGPHGTHVAGLIRGEINGLQEASGRIKLKITNVVQEATRGSPTGPITTYSSPPGGLDIALAYAAQQKVSVVNVSFAAAGRPVGIEQALRANPYMLLVASAGNDHKDLDRAPSYPAAYGGAAGDFRDQVISVAAHDGDFAPTSFTNLGEKRVDLAAPGCDIESYGFDGTKLRYSGTSQAAPLVAFTAALLLSERLSSTRAVKARILASVDIRPSFHGQEAPLTGSEGTLNIPKALSVNDDLIELKGKPGEILLDHVINSEQKIRICADEDAIELRNLLKATPNYLGDPRKLRYMIKDSEGKINFRTCATADDAVEFRAIGEDSPMSRRWQEILDFVPATFRSADNPSGPLPRARPD